ncbi:MAG: Crp/Fnr family transcriptional regulator [Thermosynechococcaceae cyanobacterium]
MSLSVPLSLSTGSHLSSLSHPVKKFPAKVFIPVQPQRLLRINKGVIRTLSYLDDGQPVVLGLWREGEVVGHSLSHVNPFYVESFTAVEANYFSLEDTISVQPFVQAHLQQIEELMIIRSHRKIDITLLKLLTWLSQKFGNDQKHGHLIDLRLTHQDIAELLGTTRVTITRLMGQFEQQGRIQRLPLDRTLIKDLKSWHYEI